MRACNWIFLGLGLLVAIPAPSRAQPAGQCEPDKLKEKYPALVGKTVNVGVSAGNLPFTFRDPKDLNKIEGIDIDLMTDVFKCIGVPWKIGVGVWSGLITAVAQGRDDVMWDSLYYTPERAKQVNYALYAAAATGFIVHKGNPKGITTVETLCGLNAAAGLGTVEETAFRAQGNKCVKEGKPDISVATYNDITQGEREIANGRLDVIMTDLTQSSAIVEGNPELEVAFHILSGFHVGVAVNKGETDLLHGIADALKIEQASGKEKAILIKYGVDPSLEYPTVIKTE